MSLDKIILEALEKNPIALKETLANILSEKIANAIDKRMNESTNVLDKHIASFSKKIKSSAAKPTRYKNFNENVPGMKHVEVSPNHSHQDVFDALKSMGYYKTKGYDSKPGEFTSRTNHESMITSSDPVHHKDGISAHFEHEHGGKMQVHFKDRSVKEEVLEEGVKDGYYVHSNMNLTHDTPFRDSKEAIRHADKKEDQTGKVHIVSHVKGGKINKQWRYNGGHMEGGWEHDTDHKGDEFHHHVVGIPKSMMKEDLDKSVDQLDELSKDTLGSYVKKAGRDAYMAGKFSREDPAARKAGRNRKLGIVRAVDRLMKEGLNEIKGDHLTSAKLIHKDLKNIDTLSPDTQKVLKRHEKQMITRYGDDWRKKAGINEDIDQLDEVISKAERRNLAYHEKQAVRAAEKANVGALPRSDKEKWIDDYIAKNFIPKGAVGSAVYSGVMKVRPIKESLDESGTYESNGEYVVKGKSPFYKQDHYLNTHETPSAHLIKRNIKHATKMSFEDATRHAKDWEKSYNPNKYKTEVVKVEK